MIGRWLRSDTGLAWILAVFAVLIALMSIAVVLAVLRSTQAITDIQASRHEQCVQQNARHDQTVIALDSQISQLPPRERAQAVLRRAGTVALIDALAPKRDCAVAFPKP